MSGRLLYAFHQLFPEPDTAGMIQIPLWNGLPALANKVPYSLLFEGTTVTRVAVGGRYGGIAPIKSQRRSRYGGRTPINRAEWPGISQGIQRRSNTLQRRIANRPEEYIGQRVEPLAEAYHIGVHYAGVGNIHADSGITHLSKVLLQLQAVEHETELAVGVAPDLVETAVAVAEIILLDESGVAGQRHHIHNVGIRAEARNQSFDQPRGPYQIRAKRALVPFFICIVSMCQHASIIEQSIDHNPLLLKLLSKCLDALLGAKIQLHHAD